MLFGVFGRVFEFLDEVGNVVFFFVGGGLTILLTIYEEIGIII